MIDSFKITNYLGDTITINMREPFLSGFLIKNVEGLGPVNANINMSESATNDGATYNSARINKRNIVFDFVFFINYLIPEINSIEKIRRLSYKYFPIKKDVTIEIVTVDGYNKRHSTILGYVESNEPQIFSDGEGASISILCPDPFFNDTTPNKKKDVFFSTIDPRFYFYDEEEPVYDNTNYYEFSSVTAYEQGVETSSIVFGAYLSNPLIYLYYEGDSETGFTMFISAADQIRNITIVHSSDEEFLGDETETLILNINLEAGDLLRVCTIKNHKEITVLRSGSEINCLDSMDRSSKWLRLFKDDNYFRIFAESGIDNLSMNINYDIKYEGI